MTTPISPEDLDEVRAHNPDHMNEDTIDKLVARVEELEAEADLLWDVVKAATALDESATTPSGGDEPIWHVPQDRVLALNAALEKVVPARVLEGTE